MIIAIDGPSGTGKSTVARTLADRLGFQYIDTGAMYRALAWALLEKKIDIEKDPAFEEKLKAVCISFDASGNILVDGRDVSPFIRTNFIGQAASDISKLSPVRRHLVHLQQEMGREGHVVMEGRDIGTKVFPGAALKFFLTADLAVRGERRYKELKTKGESANLETVTLEVQKRDKQDREREDSPLVKASDAIEIDTTHLNIKEVVQKLISFIEKSE